MNRNTLTLLSALAISPIAFPAHSQPTPTEITFTCKPLFDPASGKKIPVTVAWVPQRQGHITVIGWKSEYFSKSISIENRCAQITQKFQTFYNQNQLNYLTVATTNGYPIVCGLKTQQDKCDKTTQLFTLKPNDTPNLILTQLIDLLNGKTSAMLMQSSSDGQIFVPMQELFQKAPLAKLD